MKIGGFQPFSLSDYPGCVSAIVFTQGCNFRCPFCHNSSLVLPECYAPLIPEEEILKILNERKGKLDGVVITGGEPTIQSDLIAFVKKIKDLGYKVKLDTNGSKPEVIEELISQKLIDYFALDIKSPWHKYSTLAGVNVSVDKIKETLFLLLQSLIPCDFRTTFARPLLDEEDTKEIQTYLPPDKKLIIQRFISQNALNPTLFP